MGVSEWSGSLLEWENELSLLKERLGPVFRRSELRGTGGAFIDGLLSGISRKTGWMMSEHAGLPGPWLMQALLGRSHWDAAKQWVPLDRAVAIAASGTAAFLSEFINGGGYRKWW